MLGISFSLPMSPSLAGAHSEPIIPTMNCDSAPMSSAPFSACCWIRGRSRTSSMRERRRPWPGSRKDSRVWRKGGETDGDWRRDRGSEKDGDCRVELKSHCNHGMGDGWGGGRVSNNKTLHLSLTSLISASSLMACPYVCGSSINWSSKQSQNALCIISFTWRSKLYRVHRGRRRGGGHCYFYAGGKELRQRRGLKLCGI